MSRYESHTCMHAARTLACTRMPAWVTFVPGHYSVELLQQWTLKFYLLRPLSIVYNVLNVLLLLLLRPFDGLFRDNLSKLAPERQTILDFNKARDDGVAVASEGPYANHLHLIPDR